ncbi:MAG: HSP18 transcriptional regulator [Catenulispora sp.]
MLREQENRGPATAAPAVDTGAALGRLGRIGQALSAARAAADGPEPAPAPAPAPLSANQVLVALSLLRELRSEIAGWEPQLIEAARTLGASWADLAPALGVASRQAAERRYLRLRRTSDGAQGTRDQRVAAERDRRAGDRAVAGWARQNAAGLRQLAGQIGALTDLGAGAEADLAALRGALGRDDAADLLEPLVETRDHLRPEHPALADQVGAVDRSVAEVRAASDRRRHSAEA